MPGKWIPTHTKSRRNKASSRLVCTVNLKQPPAKSEITTFPSKKWGKKEEISTKHNVSRQCKHAIQEYATINTNCDSARESKLSECPRML